MLMRASPTEANANAAAAAVAASRGSPQHMLTDAVLDPNVWNSGSVPAPSPPSNRWSHGGTNSAASTASNAGGSSAIGSTPQPFVVSATVLSPDGKRPTAAHYIRRRNTDGDETTAAELAAEERASRPAKAYTRRRRNTGGEGGEAAEAAEAAEERSSRCVQISCLPALPPPCTKESRKPRARVLSNHVHVFEESRCLFMLTCALNVCLMFGDVLRSKARERAPQTAFGARSAR